MQITINTEKIKRQWDENPLGVITVIAIGATALAKLIDSMSAAQGRRAYARYSKRNG